jgi:hypothetical protein
MRGTNRMRAGEQYDVRITAYASNNSVSKIYNGLRNIVFSGMNASPDGASALVNGITFGSPVPIVFTNGTNKTKIRITPYCAESVIVRAFDGYLSSSAAGTNAYRVTVIPGKMSGKHTIIFVKPEFEAGVGDRVVVTLDGYDKYKNALISEDENAVRMTVSGANSESIAMGYAGSKNWAAAYIPGRTGIDLIEAAANSEKVLNDVDGKNDGIYYLTIFEIPMDRLTNLLDKSPLGGGPSIVTVENPVSIDADNLNIYFRKINNARINITIYNFAGRQIKELVKDKAVTGSGTDYVTWDLRDDRGYRLSEDVYYARYTVIVDGKKTVVYHKIILMKK